MLNQILCIASKGWFSSLPYFQLMMCRKSPLSSNRTPQPCGVSWWYFPVSDAACSPLIIFFLKNRMPAREVECVWAATRSAFASTHDALLKERSWNLFISTRNTGLEYSLLILSICSTGDIILADSSGNVSFPFVSKFQCEYLGFGWIFLEGRGRKGRGGQATFLKGTLKWFAPIFTMISTLS